MKLLLYKDFVVDLLQVEYIKHNDTMVSADDKGIIRLLDMKDFKALEPEDSL